MKHAHVAAGIGNRPLASIEIGMRFFLHFLICWFFTFIFAFAFKLPAGGYVSFAAAVGLTILGRSTVLSRQPRDGSSRHETSDNRATSDDPSRARRMVRFVGLVTVILVGEAICYRSLVRACVADNLAAGAGVCFVDSILLWVVYYCIFLRRCRDWKVQAATFLCIYASLFGFVVVGTSYRRQQDATVVASFFDRAISLLNEPNGSLSLDERIAAIEPRARGAFGEVERWMLESLERAAQLGQDLDAEVASLGWESLLDPRRWQRDTSLVESKRMVQEAKTIVDKYEARMIQCFQESADRIKSLKLSEADKQGLRTGFAGKGFEPFRQNWQRLRQMFDLYGEIVSFLGSTQWHIDGDQILFMNDADVRAYNRYLEQIQSIAASIESECPDWLRQNR